MTDGISFPTILVVGDYYGVGGLLVRDLRHQGYIVLVAQDGAEAIEVVRIHSRPIHLMLTADSMDGRTLAATLKQYRPKMQVLFHARCAEDMGPDTLRSNVALARVRELLKPPGNPAIEITEGHQPHGQAKSARA